jgi:hypothetical protein
MNQFYTGPRTAPANSFVQITHLTKMLLALAVIGGCSERPGEVVGGDFWRQAEFPVRVLKTTVRFDRFNARRQPGDRQNWLTPIFFAGRNLDWFRPRRSRFCMIIKTRAALHKRTTHARSHEFGRHKIN